MGHSFCCRSFKGLGSNRNRSQTWPCYSEIVPEQHGEVTPRQSSWVWLFSSWNILGPRRNVPNTQSCYKLPGDWKRKRSLWQEHMQPVLRPTAATWLLCCPAWELTGNWQGFLSEQLGEAKGLISSHPISQSWVCIEAFLNDLPPVNIQENKSKSNWILSISRPPSRSVL